MIQTLEILAIFSSSTHQHGQQKIKTTTMMRLSFLILAAVLNVLAVLIQDATAFTSTTTTTTTTIPNNKKHSRTLHHPSSSSSTSTSTQRHAILDYTIDSVNQARVGCVFWLIGASGAAGIARSSFPRMYKSVKLLQDLKDEGPSMATTKKDDTKMGISAALCGLPRDLYRADVDQIVNQNKLTVEQIVDKYPVEGNFLSAKGYLTYEAFKRANAKANPLTIRAIFDTLNTSVDVVEPAKAQKLLDSYKENLDNVSSQLLKSKLTSYLAIFTLLFLLGFADYEAFFVYGVEGWCPEWPGLDNLPGSLFDKETGLAAIPQYWLGDDFFEQAQ